MNRNRVSVNVLKYWMALSVILAAVLFLPTFALADAISDVAYDQQNPHTIYLIDQGASGIWLTVWEDWRNRATTGADIYGQFIKPNGTFCGPEFIITKAPGNQTVPRAAYRQDLTFPTKSKAVVVWQDTRPNYIYVNALSNIDVPAGCSFETATEKAIGFNSVREYGPYVTTQVTGEVIGTGGGTQTFFSATLSHLPVDPGSVQVSVAGVIQINTDDGSGNLSGPGGIGTVDYATGVLTVTLNTGPGTNVPVTVRYTSAAAPFSESIGFGSGNHLFSNILLNVPVAPGTVRIKVAGVLVGSDDGHGNLIGNVFSSSSYIYYNSGAIRVYLVDAPATGVPVTVDYKYLNTFAAVTDELLDYGNGFDTDFRGSLDFAPVIPGTLSVEVNGVATGTHDDGLGRLVPAIQATGELIATGDDETKTFTQVLVHHPVQQGTVVVKVGGIKKCDDSGFINGCTVLVNYDTGFVTASFTAPPVAGSPVTINYKYYAGTISYETGAVNLSFAAPPTSGDSITINYYFLAFPRAKLSANDVLLARAQPRLAYDRTADRFWVVWKETRSILHQLSELCFADNVGAIADWSFDDSDFIGYVRLEGAALFEQRSVLDVGGADIVRNSDTTTIREVASSFLALEETREYESFNLATNPDIACDDTATQCLIVSEGVRQKLTLTCDCEDKNDNDICDLADVVTSTLTEAPFDDGFVHIYGLSDNYLTLPVVSSVKLDSATETSAHYPAVGFDPISKRFLATWEDFRGGANTKIFGQLIFSGGSKYNDNFIISYQDTNNDGTNDDDVLNSKQTKPFVSYDSINQRFFVIWQDGRNSNLSTENLDIYGQKIDSEGSLRGFNFAVLNAPGNQYNPTIAFNDLTNKFLAVWKDARNAANNNCSASGGSGTGTKPCGSDVYDQIFALGQPSLTLLKMDGTALTPPLLNDFQNPPGSGSVAVGLFATQSFKVKNTGDITLKIDYINQTNCNGSPIAPFSFDGLPGELTAADGTTLNLVPGASITLTVRFTPKDGGSYNKCFIIESNGGNPQVNISALAIESNITVTPASWNFGNVFLGNFVDKTFVVRNTGLAALIISSLDPPPTPFTIQSETCTTGNITSGSTCNIVVRFTPTVVGATGPAHFSIHSNDPDSPVKNVSLSGTGVGAPAITVNPASVDFGSMQVGQSSQQTVTVRNDGTLNLKISSFSALATPFSYVSNGCKPTPFTLAPEASCQVVIKFAPTTTGSTSAGVTIGSNDPAPGKASVTVALTGLGVTTPVLTAIPSPVNFPDTMLGGTSQKAIKVTNTGNADLIITGLVNPASTEFVITGSNCIKTLHSKDGGICTVPPCACTINVAFMPTTGGFKQSFFGITSNDPVFPTATIIMNGTGKVAPVAPIISVAPSSKAFGGVVVGGKRSAVITVTNTGTANLAITTVSAPAAPFSKTDTCTGKTLAPLTDSCKITVTFAPTATGVATPSSIVIHSNDSITPAVTVIFSGTGLPKPVISISPAVIAFGNQVVGTTSAARKVTVTNNGDPGSSLKINSVVSTSPFNIVSDSDTCSGNTLVAGAACSVKIEFNPTMAVPFLSSLTFNSNDPVTPGAEVTLSGTGVL